MIKLIFNIAPKLGIDMVIYCFLLDTICKQGVKNRNVKFSVLQNYIYYKFDVLGIYISILHLKLLLLYKRPNYLKKEI